MASKKTATDSARTEKAKSTEAEKATGTLRKITDLSLGDIVLIPGFDGPRIICTATKAGDGADTGKFEVALRDETGEVEHARFGPDEEVQVVGKAPKGAKDRPVPAESAARKTTKGKGTKNKAPKPEGAKKPKAPAPPKEKKTSALDAAAKVLGESGEPMNCQEMIKAMPEKGYWKSPGGLTLHATPYSALLREIKAKGKEVRFKKANRGQFSLRSASLGQHGSPAWPRFTRGLFLTNRVLTSTFSGETRVSFRHLISIGKIRLQLVPPAGSILSGRGFRRHHCWRRQGVGTLAQGSLRQGNHRPDDQAGQAILPGRHRQGTDRQKPVRQDQAADACE